MKYTPPYFSQWESSEKTIDFVTDKNKINKDENRQNSGAENLEEYVKWSPHLCGAACLKMLLAHKFQKIEPLMHIKNALSGSAFKYYVS